MRDHVARMAVEEFTALKEEMAPLLESLGSRALVALVRQHHHNNSDQGWVFDTIAIKHLQEGMVDRSPGVFYGELTEARDTNEGQTMKRVRIYLDPETLDSIEFETYEEA